MKRSFVMLLVLICLTGVTALSALAQRGGPPPGGDGRHRPPDNQLSGRVLKVQNQGKQIVIGFYVLFPSPDAPGKAPDRFAEQAAKLLRQANDFERNGDKRNAARAREVAEKLMCWREVERTITPAADRIPIFGIQRSPVTAIPKGALVRLTGSVEGDAPAGKLPDRLALTSDIFKLDTPEPATYARTSPSPLPPIMRRTFFAVRGVVTSVAPFTVSAGNQSIQIDVPPHARFIQLAPIEPREIQAGHFVRATVRLVNGTEIAAIERLVIFPEEPQGPPERGGM